MKRISFKNFRRFQDFPSLNLGNISIMVGRNNSGKSTMVKALLLFLDYLTNQQYDEFSFTSKSLEDANIVTFGRAKNNKCVNNEISIEIGVDGYNFSIYIYGNDEDTSARVSKLIVEDTHLNTTFEINYIQQIISVLKHNPKLITKFDSLNDLLDEWQDIERDINKEGFRRSSAEGLRLIDRYNSLGEKIEVLNKNLNKERDNVQNSVLFNLSYPLKQNIENNTEDTILQEFVSDFVFLNDTEIRKYKDYLSEKDAANKSLDGASDNIEIDIAGLKIEEITRKIELLELGERTLEEKIQELIDVDNYRSDISKSIDNSIKAINALHIYYLGANPSKQSALFSIRDKQNNLAQAIHDFRQSKIINGEPEYNFVKFWMKEFEVGEDFLIEFYAGEAYEIYIIDQEGLKAHLADKGMGSLQAMMLILKVSTIMRKHKKTMKYVTIIIEEPELNLHPALQSKLATFFHTINTEYGIEFIIETHSEYLIRKTQLFVMDNKYTDKEGLNPNPFSLHYFDLDSGPYEMKYLENGYFNKNFGDGFYDVASKATMKMIHNNKVKN